MDDAVFHSCMFDLQSLNMYTTQAQPAQAVTSTTTAFSGMNSKLTKSELPTPTRMVASANITNRAYNVMSPSVAMFTFQPMLRMLFASS